MRAFVAIELPQATRNLLAGIQEALIEVDPAWAGEKWVRPVNLHLTLAFMPDLSPGQTEDVLDRLTDGCRGSAPFRLEVSTVLPKPRLTRARMLWASFDGDLDSARSLTSIVSDALTDHLQQGHPRAFIPHATLVRARRPRPCEPEGIAAAQAILTSADADSRIVSVASVTLFSSILHRSGPTYEVLGSVGLGS